MPETTTPPEIQSFTQSQLASGLTLLPTSFPIGTIQTQTIGAGEYMLIVQSYLPDGSSVTLNWDITNINQYVTEAGLLNLRLFDFEYTSPDPIATTFSLWQFIVTYAINDGPSAQGVYPQVTGPLPSVPNTIETGIVTKRGTVLIISKT